MIDNDALSCRWQIWSNSSISPEDSIYNELLDPDSDLSETRVCEIQGQAEEKLHRPVDILWKNCKLN